MFIVESITIIDRPVEEVFVYLADMTNSPHWCPAVRSIWQIEGNGIEAGAVYQADEVPLFYHVRNQYRLISFDAPNKLIWEFHATVGKTKLPILSGRGKYLLRRDKTGTHVVHHNELKLSFLFKLMQPIFRRMANETLANQLSRLKVNLENERGRHLA
jgi:uncharacterized membrane protein